MMTRLELRNGISKQSSARQRSMTYICGLIAMLMVGLAITKYVLECAAATGGDGFGPAEERARGRTMG